MAKILIFLFFISCLTAQDEAFKVKSFKEIRTKDTILQGYEESCGASALATIMNFYGNSYTEEDIIDAIRKTDMLNFNEMANIARRMNFEAGGFKIDKDIFNNLEIPVIARVDNRENYAHFVVVQNHNGDFVSVFDPNSGYYIQSKKDFLIYGSRKTTVIF